LDVPDKSARANGMARVLFVLNREKDEHAVAIERAGRNLAVVTILPHSEVSAHALLSHSRVIFTKNAYEALAEVCSG
jgi:ribosomal protein L4